MQDAPGATSTLKTIEYKNPVPELGAKTEEQGIRKYHGTPYRNKARESGKDLYSVTTSTENTCYELGAKSSEDKIQSHTIFTPEMLEKIWELFLKANMDKKGYDVKQVVAEALEKAQNKNIKINAVGVTVGGGANT